MSEALANTTIDEGLEIKEIFEKQRANENNIAKTSYKQRIKKLNRLMKCVLVHRQEIRDALHADFKKPPEEVDLTEIYTITKEVKFVRSKLHEWMGDHKVSTPLSLFGASSHIKYQPKGVCLIISPWNFPLQLTFGPLVSAIAAGNCVMLKPSENTPHTTDLMKKMIEKVFDRNEVAICKGGVSTAQTLLKLPFDHIFFTGSTTVGKIVMEAASKNLSSVTLELGGKSPTIVDKSANLKQAAKRISYGKFVNSGQICIAPDYVLVHQSKKEQLIDALKREIKNQFGDDPINSKDYCEMVNDGHFKRVRSYLEEAVKAGASVISGGRMEESTNSIEPTIVVDADENSSLLSEEIFGPILPIVTFHEIEEAIDFVNDRENPLALYVYSQHDKVTKKIIAETKAGATCININDIHFYNSNLPFGGSGHSGIGKAHGWFGFEAFSNARAIFKQHVPGPIDLLAPPYKKWKQKLIDLTIKWL